ncbi:helix-turn-helix domain-containing protein [Flavobacterium sp.]|uniref:helix-turn-helix domain-containing protein n=1 Tax=Flavobacterium sp. TaxID=239 RepID=UPI0039E2B656
MLHFNSLADMHRANNYPAPEIPLLSLMRCTQSCPSGATEFTGDFYMVSFKKMKSGTITYGRTRYDHQSGSMFFTRPRQTLEMRNIELEEEGFGIYFHDDYLSGHPLHAEIKKYGFFDYETNEALHLSPKEEQTIWELYAKIENEYHNNPDEFSRGIILGHLDSILKYSQRFYKRQFLNRIPMAGTTVTRFNDALSAYAKDGNLSEKGLPSVASISKEMQMSPRYLSDLLKQETGKTAIDLIHIFLVSEAKNLLAGENQTVAEIAYRLGFENPPYFSRLFKKETGLSPNQFKREILN